MFKSLDEIKAVGEKFEAGKIIPNRVIKATDRNGKKLKWCVKFGADMYRVQSHDGNQIFIIDFTSYTFDTAAPVKIIAPLFNGSFKGAPYGGSNFFVGNHGIDNEEWLANINRRVFGKLAIEI